MGVRSFHAYRIVRVDDDNMSEQLAILFNSNVKIIYDMLWKVLVVSKATTPHTLEIGWNTPGRATVFYRNPIRLGEGSTQVQVYEAINRAMLRSLSDYLDNIVKAKEGDLVEIYFTYRGNEDSKSPN